MDSYKGSKSIAFNRTTLSENQLYASILCEELNVFLETVTNKANATIFDVQINDPLNMVVLHFDKSIKNIEARNVDALRDSLRSIDSYTVKEKAKSIYVKKDIKFWMRFKKYAVIKMWQSGFGVVLLYL